MGWKIRNVLVVVLLMVFLFMLGTIGVIDAGNITLGEAMPRILIGLITMWILVNTINKSDGGNNNGGEDDDR